jgi:hypothetical protein
MNETQAKKKRAAPKRATRTPEEQEERESQMRRSWNSLATRTPAEQEHIGSMAFHSFAELWRATREKTAPHPNAVSFVGKLFVKWWRAGGTQSLEQAFGLAAPGRGRGSMMSSFDAQLRDAWYLQSMALLVGAGFTVDEAAEAVAESWKSSTRLVTDLQFPAHFAGEEVAELAHFDMSAIKKINEKPLQAKTVRDLFERQGGVKQARENNYMGDPDSFSGEHESSNLGERRTKFISELAPHLIPLRLKSSEK